MSEGRRRQLLTAGLVGAGVGVVVALGQALLVQGVDSLLPNVRRLSSYNRPGTVTVLSADGQVIQKLGPATREKVTAGQMPQLVQRAFIAAEDRRFYQHDGIDPVGIGRAMVRNLRKGSVEEGASTITQQTAKSLLGQQSSKSVTRIIEKLKEWIVAIRLESNLTKEEIITLYLNMVNYGDETYGIRNAAKTYFQKEPGQLAVEEAAVLVGLLKGSTRYNPRRNPKAAMARRNTVIDQMVRNDVLTKEEARAMKIAPIQLKYQKLDENSGIAPYFREILREELKGWCKENENPATGEHYDI